MDDDEPAVVPSIVRYLPAPWPCISQKTPCLISCFCFSAFAVFWGSFSFGHGADRRSIHVLPAAPEAQSLWMLSGIAGNFFPTTVVKRGKSSLRRAFEQASEAHRKLWPGVVVPKIVDGDSTSESCMPTSLLMAYIVHMISMQKRATEFRLRAYHLLKAFIERLAVHQPMLDFLIVDVNGQGQWVTQQLLSAVSCAPWSTQFFQRHLQMTWLSDLSSRDKPWVTSFPSDGQIHLADWIAFSLDFPKWIKDKRANREILWAKQILERSALSVMTQLALRIEQHLKDITAEIEDQKVLKKEKIKKPMKWGYVASAMELVFAKQESLTDQC